MTFFLAISSFSEVQLPIPTPVSDVVWTLRGVLEVPHVTHIHDFFQ